MLMQAQPVFDCYRAVEARIALKQKTENKTRVVYLTPQGKTFDQKMAKELSEEENLIFLCGHYEGIDERVLEEIVTDYVSIGDYVLTGGELPAMVMIDAIARLVPGVLHNEASADFETFHNDLLEYPQYSRPEQWHGKGVPQVLLSGDHKRIAQWRVKQSQERTKLHRPDLYELYEEKQQWIRRLLKKGKNQYMDVTESLRRGRGNIWYASDDGLIVCDASAKLYMLCTFRDEKACEIVSKLPAEADGWQFLVHQEALVEPLKDHFHISSVTCVRQAVYTQKVSLPLPKDIEFLKLASLYAEDVSEQYHVLASRSYVEKRLQTGNVYGAFVEGELTGFVGVHTEGSLGMLHVFEKYRRRGIGYALEAFMINLQLALGYTPYGQIIADNTASMELQKKMKLCISKEVMYWAVSEHERKDLQI